jgi:hypothetical protein
MKRSINTSGLSNAESLFMEIRRAWNEISWDTINNLMNSLKPRICTLEDVHGASLSGHQDMIRCYQAMGPAARQKAVVLMEARRVPSSLIEAMRQRLDVLLAELSQATTFVERQNLISAFDAHVETLKSALPR